MPLNNAEILLEQGVIDEDQLRELKKKANKEGHTFLEQVILDQICSEEDIAQNLSIGMGLPLVYLTQLRIPGYVAKILPRERALSLKAIPVSLKRENEEEVLYAAFFDPTDADAVKEVELAAGRAVKMVVAGLSDIKNAIARYNVALNVKKRPTAQVEAVKVESEESELPPLPEAAANPDFEIDLGVDAVESVTPPSQPKASADENPVEEFSAADFDPDLEVEAVSEVPSGEKVAFQRSEISFEDENFAVEADKPEQEVLQQQAASQNDKKDDDSFDFLSITSNALSQDDGVIEHKREESKKVKQTHAWGVEDLDFKEEDGLSADQADEKKEVKPRKAEKSDSLEFEIPPETAGGEEFATKEFKEDEDDFNLDLAFESSTSDSNILSETSNEKLDDFDFDFGEAIPPAPKLDEKTAFEEVDKRPTKEFEVKFSEDFSFEELENSQNEIKKEPAPAAKETPAPARAAVSPQLAKREEVARKIDDGVDFNFDDVVADLDRLLEGGCEIKSDGTLGDDENTLPRELCEALVSIADEAGESVSSHEVDRIYEIMIGRRPAAEDERTQKLRALFKDRIQKFIDQI